ncbi:imelysin family protein [Mucilaginibacter sp. SMC90]|uniref:imelysin family protein n=1 Tax=Mucilaginibacter sp. SMC90 TaxID=2929803 RepID=UPI001FB2BB34|nr:imelysin family protein [Mucilaginibacter sp. SMC90]UOE46248.1 imelysin family protein [Mucilaginibacter sp. SMC90]
MRKITLGALLLFATGLILVQSCSKSGAGNNGGDKSDNTFDRKALLTNMSANIILPAYTSFQASASALNDAVIAFNSSPDAAKLTAAQNAFTAAYKQWQSTSEFDFGPANQINFRVSVNTYPADLSQISANINSGAYNPGLLANLAAKGLPAIDYLLFGAGADNAAILTQYTTDSHAANRKTYLAALALEIKTSATTVLSSWNGAYKSTFLSADGTDVGSSLGQLVNQLVYDYEIIKNYEIGVPAGVQSMGTVFPQKVQAYYSKTSLQLTLLHIQAMQNLYLGKSAAGDGLGLDDYLAKINAKYSDGKPLNDVIKAQFAAAIAKLQVLTDPLADNIRNNPTAVTAAYTELQKLTVLLKTDMTSSLGILITFGDNDGD